MILSPKRISNCLITPYRIGSWNRSLSIHELTGQSINSINLILYIYLLELLVIVIYFLFTIAEPELVVPLKIELRIRLFKSDPICIKSDANIIPLKSIVFSLFLLTKIMIKQKYFSSLIINF